MPEDTRALSVAEIGSFFVGGRMHRLQGMPRRERIGTPGGAAYSIDSKGEIMLGQMYVQYVRLANPRAAAPLLMWHGGGMSGACWESTPDGRPAWQMSFLRAGFSTYVSDAVERGRASWARPTRRPIQTRPTSAPPGRRGRRRSASALRARGIPTPRCGAFIPACASPSSILMLSYASACPAGIAMTY